MGWVRPKGPPRVYRLEECTNKSTGKTSTFIFQELEENRFQDVMELAESTYLSDEPVHRSFDVANNPKELNSFRYIMNLGLKQGISIGVFEESQDKSTKPILAGFNILKVVNSDKYEGTNLDLITGPKMKMLVQTFGYIEKGILEHFRHLGDKHLTSTGLCVAKEYRGLGLAKTLLDIRSDVGKAYNLPFTATVFSWEASQTIGRHLGFRDYISMNYEDLISPDTGKCEYPEELWGQSFKIMIKNLSKVN